MVINDLEVSIRSITIRKPVPDCPLDVGRPNVTETSFHTSLSIEPGSSVGALISTGGYGFILIRIQAQENNVRQ